jgi:DNA-binding NarL/FixJ family response regulator
MHGERGHRILVVDDDLRFRKFVATVLERAGFEHEEVADGDEALASAAAARPELVLLDVSLPRISGYELCRELRDLFGVGLPIIFVSGVRTESMDRVSGLLVGADDYLVKPFDPDELLARIRALLRKRLAQDNPPARSDESFGDLTRRELEVLRLLADGLTQDEIGRELVISPRTVGTHIQNLLGKLEVHSRAQAVAIAHRVGLVDSAEDSNAVASGR